MGIQVSRKLTPAQIEAIERAFHDWNYIVRNNKLPRSQEEVLSSLGISHHYVGRNGGKSVVLEYGGNSRRLASNLPSDVITRKVISFYKEFVNS